MQHQHGRWQLAIAIVIVDCSIVVVVILITDVGCCVSCVLYSTFYQLYVSM